MNTYERIKELAKLKKISIRQLEINFGYSNGYIGSWKRQTPNSVELARLADYFDVSVDYLLGRTDNPSISNEDSNKSMAKQVMMRMNTNGLTEEDLEDIEKEMETFFKWRLEQIRQEREQGGK
ncbi:helix-turn-helix domain-containing protein [Candidatus Enterococcus leclercqii]|uniref:helix-turn-helix domain-containing protein n=1 Tax=Candidatus Enterococcus leclercqii TaxID=1857218 RepID=UPI00137B3F27|nr:helix-turn-helix transcriptional regulator [Enterococcus sp. CU9D]KAF1291085.1 transcriptional regulator [Enterococcus sp. CU9D]